jgi:hypothetical protein
VGSKWKELSELKMKHKKEVDMIYKDISQQKTAVQFESAKLTI